MRLPKSEPLHDECVTIKPIQVCRTGNNMKNEYIPVLITGRNVLDQQTLLLNLKDILVYLMIIVPKEIVVDNSFA